MSMMLGTPYSRVGASTSYLESLAAFMAARPDVLYKVEPGTAYGQQRNRLVAHALNAHVDWLLQVDDDIRWPPNLVKLLKDGPPVDARVIIGSVPLGHGQPVNVFEDPSGLAREFALPVPEPPARPLPRRIKGFGGAVMLVRTDVYVEMAEKLGPGIWYCHEQISVDGVVHELEPDVSFARRLIALDIPAWAVYGAGLTHTKPQEWRGI